MTPYYDRQGVTIYHGDSRQVLEQLPDESVHCVVTSPPYWGLRDYGENGQMGLEETPEEFIAGMVELFGQVRRVLRTDGTLWLNMGDSYAAQGGRHDGRTDNQNGVGARRVHLAGGGDAGTRQAPTGLKPKDLCGIPWRLALALQADGWWLRQDIIWHKPNPMPESVTDRCTKAHEYIFLMTKAARYYYDADAVREVSDEPDRIRRDTVGGAAHVERGQHSEGGEFTGGATRNRRSVWTIPTAPYKDAHFATFPEALVKPCILAGTSAEGACPDCGKPWERVVEREPMKSRRSDRGALMGEYGRTVISGQMVEPPTATTTGWRRGCDCDAGQPVPCVVLDPFHGSGTTGQVARKNGCHYVGIELNADYIDLSLERFKQGSLF